MTKVFISYHHERDQDYKNHLVDLATKYGTFEDCSVDTGDIDENLTPEQIRIKIRDEYLRDSQVTILLCGKETKGRKHVDWELKSSMIDGSKNQKSGILVINVNDANQGFFQKSLPGEGEEIYPEISDWQALETKADYKSWFPDLPDRIIDNLITTDVQISIVPWERVENNHHNLQWLIDETAKAGKTNEYDLSRPMRRQNSNVNSDYETVIY